MNEILELMKHPLFAYALRTFYWMQIWGELHRNNTGRDDILIADIMDEFRNSQNSVLNDYYTEWESLSDDPAECDRIHQGVGRLIAHHFPGFAALCTIPVYVVFDYSDNDGNGVYRMAAYHNQA